MSSLPEVNSGLTAASAEMPSEPIFCYYPFLNVEAELAESLVDQEQTFECLEVVSAFTICSSPMFSLTFKKKCQGFMKSSLARAVSEKRRLDLEEESEHAKALMEVRETFSNWRVLFSPSAVFVESRVDHVQVQIIVEVRENFAIWRLVVSPSAAFVESRVDRVQVHIVVEVPEKFATCRVVVSPRSVFVERRVEPEEALTQLEERRVNLNNAISLLTEKRTEYNAAQKLVQERRVELEKARNHYTESRSKLEERLMELEEANAENTEGRSATVTAEATTESAAAAAAALIQQRGVASDVSARGGSYLKYLTSLVVAAAALVAFLAYLFRNFCAQDAKLETSLSLTGWGFANFFIKYIANFKAKNGI